MKVENCEQVMMVKKQYSYMLKDSDGHTVTIKQFNDSFKLIVDGESRFTFTAKDCDNLMSIFTEIKDTAIKKVF